MIGKHIDLGKLFENFAAWYSLNKSHLHSLIRTDLVENERNLAKSELVVDRPGNAMLMHQLLLL